MRHPRFDVGALFVGRWQRDRLDPNDPRETRTTVTAFPVDAYARVLLTPYGAPYRMLLEAEGATVNGRTNRAYGEETFEDGSAIHSFGALVRLRFDDDPTRVTAKIEAGFATGDNDLRDDVVRTFSFHTDHDVGMLLFDELLPLVTARAADRASDPALLAVPPTGLRYTVNQGAVSNAIYLAPVIRWRPVPALDLRVGWVAAWTAGDFVDAYQTGVHGGYNHTPGGVPLGSHALGHEVDLGLRYTIRVPGATAVHLGAEGAAFVPGAAFDGVGGDRLATQFLGRGRVSFTW
jgi:hypothetical protein